MKMRARGLGRATFNCRNSPGDDDLRELGEGKGGDDKRQRFNGAAGKFHDLTNH